MSTRSRACPRGHSINSEDEQRGRVTYLDQVVRAVHDSDAPDGEGGVVGTLDKRESKPGPSVTFPGNLPK